MQALGVALLDEHNRPLPPGGLALAELARIDLSKMDPRLAQVSFEIAADVDNPLCGPHGASAIFGPQRSEEHTSELQSLMRISYAVFCLNKKTNKNRFPHRIFTINIV